MTTRILIGDVRQRLRDLPDESVHCVVTSPPYFGLRDYGCDGQIGLEATPDAYVIEMVAVFRSVKRVLRADGTFWLNLGDSYAGGKTGRADHGSGDATSRLGHNRDSIPNGTVMGAIHQRKPPPGVHAKQRLMIPARVALALQADGWWLRDEIIWHKPNPMPVSVTDRTTPAHEMLYMFTKSSRYYYDMEAVKEPASPNTHATGKGGYRGPVDNGAITNGDRGDKGRTIGARDMRQPRSVWTVTPKPFKGAHFATFPPDLIKPCILAGCPAGGTVLDPFFGAGTTGLVAQQLGRNTIGIELNPEYATIARERLGIPTTHPWERVAAWNAAVSRWRAA